MSTELSDLRDLFWRGPSTKNNVHVQALVDAGCVVITISGNVTINFELFRRVSAFLSTKDIEVDKESCERWVSNVATETWHRVTFTARGVPKYLVKALARDLEQGQ